MASLGELVSRLDQWQRTTTPVSVGIAVGKKFSEDNAGKLASVVAYYAFFSLFPLLLALVTVLGFVLDGRPELRADLIDSAIGQIPVVGSDLAATDGLRSNGLVLVVGLAGALWAGFSAVLAAQHAMNEVWDVPHHERPNFVTARVRALLLVIVVAIGLVSATALSSLAASADGVPFVGDIGLRAGSIVLNVLTVWVVFQVLTAKSIGWSTLLPGAIVGGVAYFLLQEIGVFIVQRYVSGATDTYGTFALVIGLLTWLHVLAQATLLASELNVVLARRLHPRSLTGDDLTPADRRALLSHYRGAEQDERLTIDDLRADRSTANGADDRVPFCGHECASVTPGDQHGRGSVAQGRGRDRLPHRRGSGTPPPRPRDGVGRLHRSVGDRLHRLLGLAGARGRPPAVGRR